MFPAFRSSDFRRFWSGAFVSNIGTWIHHTAFGWLVYELTGSAFWLGATSFVGLSPALILSLYGGVIADRVNRRRLLVVTQAVLMCSALALSALTATEVVTLGQVLAISFISGTAMAMATPVYQTLLHELVPAEHLMNAISLNSVQFNLARILGPVLAGVAMAVVGLAGCFAINAFSFIAMIIGVLSIRIVAVAAAPSGTSISFDLKQGIAYAWRTPLIRASLLLSASLSLFGFPYIVLLPAFARDLLGLDGSEYGRLLACPGAGAVLGGITLALLGNVRRKGLLAAGASIVFGVTLAGFALSTTPVRAGAFLFLVGLAMVGAISTLNTLLQLTVDSSMRGRVMSMQTLALFGFAPIGSLLTGVVASQIGTPHALACGGLACLGAGILAPLIAPHLRQPLVRSQTTRDPAP